eukprot:TRINITY_DN21398_c0_g4_i1.p1 TRINITY_DN21398_c0_g4~~TRINITY_DN21398_c0_g4_i1.p1  ORF type:complete len:338 (-),score=39.29 TRINITY_DN21398_c0_g4_i1:81-1094(-)
MESTAGAVGLEIGGAGIHAPTHVTQQPVTCVGIAGLATPDPHPCESRGFLGNAATRSSQAAVESLNSDPYNLRAEELALKDCTLGQEVRRTWSEKEMVCSFDGRLFPGTPDGMYESWDGALTCVQVVRVPLLSELTPQEVQTTLAQTVLTKVVKSQAWLRASHVVPNDFIIFCWLPFPIPDEATAHAEALMCQVQELDPRFSLRLRVPNEGDALFPARFACNHDVETQRLRGASWSDVATYTGTNEDTLDDSDDECLWDITWAWGDDIDDAVMSPTQSSSTGGDSDETEFEGEWDITWDWNDMYKDNGGAQARDCLHDEGIVVSSERTRVFTFDDGG